MDKNDPIVIVNYARTPLGAFQGAFANYSAVKLGSSAISAAIQKSGIDPTNIQEVIMGCVLSAGLGQNAARQAALGAQLLDLTVCSTVNKVCGSGMKAVMNGCDTLLSNDPDVHTIVAGGMENMTCAPYYLDKARSGYRMGNTQMYDHMFVDGLTDVYSGKSMGVYADETANELKISRAEQDEFALRSLELATAATKSGIFANEICPISITDKNGTVEVTTDECLSKAKPEKIPQLKPAFTPDGTVTAANSSSIADGAAALVLMRQSTAKRMGVQPIAKILGYASGSQAPQYFTTAPICAIQKLFKKLNLRIDDIDLFEINEAFSVVTLATVKELSIDINKVNILGGACSIGHPIGASGARIICTLLTALQHANKKVGLASLCIGGGEATALAVELY